MGPGSLRRAARAGLQDSMPRVALLSIHARVTEAGPSAWADPSLVQVWGPRYRPARSPSGGTARGSRSSGPCRRPAPTRRPRGWPWPAVTCTSTARPRPRPSAGGRPFAPSTPSPTRPARSWPRCGPRSGRVRAPGGRPPAARRRGGRHLAAGRPGPHRAALAPGFQGRTGRGGSRGAVPSAARRGRPDRRPLDRMSRKSHPAWGVLAGKAWIRCGLGRRRHPPGPSAWIMSAAQVPRPPVPVRVSVPHPARVFPPDGS